jgi:phosphonate metabolism protein (transferase hexapeptide repeat family)
MSLKMLGLEPTIHETANIRDSRFGRYTEVGARTMIAETDFGDYSYIVHDGSIIYATIGKFCSIAAFARINPGNHATWRASQHHFTYRSRQYGFDLGDDTEFFEWRRDHHVTIGNDVWIGHGAVIMPGVTIGDGAVVGSSAGRHQGRGALYDRCRCAGQGHQTALSRAACRTAERGGLVGLGSREARQDPGGHAGAERPAVRRKVRELDLLAMLTLPAGRSG